MCVSGGSQSKDCTRGFPDNPLVSEINNYMRSSTVTLLIPAMNFTCNSTIAGFAVAGTSLNRGLNSQLQIWRKNNSVYYKAGNIIVNTGGRICASWSIVNITYGCTLFEVSRLSVQSGDILGLELPNNNNEILFALNVGPVNYIHEHAYQLNSTITLSQNENDSIANQLPQIIFNFTSGKQFKGT